MKPFGKRSLILIALALVAGVVSLVWLVSRPDDPDERVGQNIARTSPGPSFEVRVIVPRLARPLAGILPDWLVGKLDGTPSELRLDHRSGGVQIGKVGSDRVELRAEGWDLLIETDAEGRIAQGTRLLFPLALGGRHVRLNCRPADRPMGYLSSTKRADSGELEGHFLVELASCKNADSGQSTNWPPAPLTVRGSFAGLKM